ncbi:hypothetical protein GGS21DRAFT_522109 [Xylaria nigripes]|nr:hypothetical protein GGS21DRAFT_522109 [Xylaria nigripes]
MPSSQKSQPNSQGGIWMYADPYAYQYSDFASEYDAPDSQGRAAGSAPGESGESTPTSEECFELEAEPLMKPARGSNQSSCRLSRSHRSTGRGSRGCSSRHEYTRDEPVNTAPGSFPRPPQPPSAGLITVLEDCPLIPVPEESYLIPVQEESYLMPVQEESYLIPVQHEVRKPATARSYQGRPGAPGSEGLIPAEEDVSPSKGPGPDFDAILRNIGPTSKERKWKMWRERSSRYYDRYSSNFG